MDDVSSLSASREPNGVPRPLEEQTETVSACAHHPRGGTPVATSALRAGPVEAHLETQAPGLLGNGGEVLEGEHLAAGGVVGVFFRHRSLGWGK
jgi:hypothetical protein